MKPISVAAGLWACTLCSLAGPASLPCHAQNRDGAKPDEAPASAKPQHYPQQLGKGNPKIKIDGDKTYVWAGPREHPPTSDAAEWYDFGGSLIPAEELQFGIGKDSIRAIDDPLFVKPDDPRLLKHVPPSPYRPEERAATNDEIRVIGYMRDGEARAYPTGLLDRHELVNDRIGGKPVTVGW